MIKYAELIKEVALKKGDERASKCGYDLFMGLEQGNVRERFNVWKDYLNEDDGTDEQRDGVWVPAIKL